MISIENRDDSYEKLKSSNSFGDAQQKVLDALHKFGTLDDKGIVQASGLSLSSVCGRRDELMKLGIVAEAGSRYDPQTNRTVTLWRVIYGGEQSTQQTMKPFLLNSEMVKLEKLLRKLRSFGDHPQAKYQRNRIRGWLECA